MLIKAESNLKGIKGLHYAESEIPNIMNFANDCSKLHLRLKKVTHTLKKRLLSE